MEGKTVIFSAPSGAGKSTIVRNILAHYPGEFEFSISATSRKPRGTEKDGVEYYFIEADRFRELIAQDAFVEHEEVYQGRFYGTLKSEVERIWKDGKTIIFDVDVKGGVNLKKYFGEKALAVFIGVPDPSVLRERLTSRGTDSPEEIEKRLQKAAEETLYAPQFDTILMNDELQRAFSEAEKLVDDFLKRP